MEKIIEMKKKREQNEASGFTIFRKEPVLFSFECKRNKMRFWSINTSLIQTATKLNTRIFVATATVVLLCNYISRASPAISTTRPRFHVWLVAHGNSLSSR